MSDGYIIGGALVILSTIVSVAIWKINRLFNEAIEIRRGGS